MPITRLLIANRGELAIRIARASADPGLRSVAVHSRVPHWKRWGPQLGLASKQKLTSSPHQVDNVARGVPADIRAARMKISVPWTVPITWRQRACPPFCIRKR